ncbi:DNA methylase [Pseudomonas sp. RIT-PI-AD]|uniref:DNA methylase n=1 Tax=Pseudomonas sp. RIT-PI-AD TaxID=3035294 RepID=UPI0021D873C7|nr:DNA methylase [Pseudomonas sp. RIT-PI-AD]
MKDITAKDLGIDLQEDSEDALFKWFLASFLFGKRIQRDIAAEAYRVIADKYRCATPAALAHCGRRRLVGMLGEARYVRYDESTAARLLKLCARLEAEYGGRFAGILAASADRRDFERHLQTFEGVGPKTVEIFMREAGRVCYPDV